MYISQRKQIKIKKSSYTQKPAKNEEKKTARSLGQCYFNLALKVKNLRHVLGIQLYTASLNLPAQGVMSYKMKFLCH